MKQLLLLISLIPFTLLFQPPPIPNQDNPPDICQSSENILPNCNFDGGMDRWQPFTEDGTANFAVLQGGGECHAPLCPAGYIVVEDHFVGGIYQQVAVTKGKTYYANIVWLVFDSLANDKGVHDATGGIGRRLGIDPTGGTDPHSANVIWGPENWRNDCKICDKQEVVATAQADTITLFLRIDNRWKVKAKEKGYPLPPSKDQFWIDDIGMKEVGGDVAALVQPTEPPPPPTDTPAPPPPTDTPVPEAPAETATPLPTEIAVSPIETPTEIAQIESAEAQPVSPIATPTPEANKVIAPPPTLTPTQTPLPTDTPAPRPTPTRHPRVEAEPKEPPISAGLVGAAGTMICVGGAALTIIAVVMGGLVWLYRLGWGGVEDDESDDDFDDEEIIVEIVE